MARKFPKYSPVVLFREDITIEKEKRICDKYFVTTNSRSNINGGDIVIGRYSVLPFYNELEKDLLTKGAKLINSFNEHRYIADLKNWTINYDNKIPSLKQYTPKTWTRLVDVPDDVGPVILKGETNSRKDKWSELMFCENKKKAIETYIKLKEDSLFDNQEIYIREFVKFKTYFLNPINKQPITHEFRFFCYKKEILAGGYYWSNFTEEIKEKPNVNDVPIEFLNKIINIVSENVNFYVLDVAQLENGEWLLVEINDGQSAGLCGCNPDDLYKKLKYLLWDKEYKELEKSVY